MTNGVVGNTSEAGHSWTDLYNLARLCLCKGCEGIQLSDVVFSMIIEPDEKIAETVRSSVETDVDELRSILLDLIPIKALVAASLIARDILGDLPSLGIWQCFDGSLGGYARQTRASRHDMRR